MDGCTVKAVRERKSEAIEQSGEKRGRRKGGKAERGKGGKGRVERRDVMN